MSRFYDRISSITKDPEEKKLLRGCVLINMQNIVDYYESYTTAKITKDGRFCINDLSPNIAPPFPKMFFEFKLDERFGATGVLIDSSNNGSGWDMLAYIFCERVHLQQAIWGFFLRSDVDGKNIMVYDEPTSIPMSGSIGMVNESIMNDIPKRMELGQTLAYIFMGPVLTAISFMHCKNVTAVEHNPPEKVQRKRQKNNKPPLTKYYTLEIEPMKKILKSEGRVDEVGLQRALHICRGHFKDYSNGKGLFGKYKGLYWWDSTVRGNPEAGRIEKDYAIKI